MPEETLEDVLRETRRAAKDLADASARLSRKLLSRAEVAARDPSATARKVGQRVAQELDAASREIDRILNEL